MSKTITITVQYEVEETEGDYGSAEQLRKCLVEKFTHREGSVMEDYARDEDGEVWGGYDGAHITAGRIVASEVKGG